MAIENLIENVDKHIIKFRTKSLDISFNELYDMFQNGELTISPDYQRLFRWEEEAQSRFIESLILEMPIPPIFVIETDNGIYELIDGLQRISSYLRFRGEKLNITDNSHLILQGCDIVPDLNGLSFDQLPKALQIKIRRSFVRMEVVKKENEVLLKYHMFKRLNTGGKFLSAQEIRNCTIRLLDSKAINFLEDCSNDKNFKNSINRIGDDKQQTRYDQELVLRFFAIKNDIDNYRFPETEYLTRYLENITTGDIAFDYRKEWQIFCDTFEFINKHFSDNAFSGKTPNDITRNEFMLYYFDGVVISVATLIDRIKSFDNVEAIIERINQIKFGGQLKSHKISSINNVKARIRLFKEGVEQILDSK